MSQLLTWQRLTCSECPSEMFLRIVHLKWKDGGGTSDEPGGVMCAQCHAIVDVGQMIRRKQLDMKRAELKAMQEEMGDAVSEPSAGGVSPREPSEDRPKVGPEVRRAGEPASAKA